MVTRNTQKHMLHADRRRKQTERVAENKITLNKEAETRERESNSESEKE